MARLTCVLPDNGFTFKQFFIAHDRCAMKVGTDGVLLGAWAPVAAVRRILDIGTGSGLLALMLAQRTRNEVLIDAIELDARAASQARDNVRSSRWQPRIRIINDDVLLWCQRQAGRYDLIISNPPYFNQGVPCASVERDKARNALYLRHENLLQCALQLISEEGMFCLILPQQTGETLALTAQQQGWHCRLRTYVQENAQRPAHRLLLGLSPAPGEEFTDRLTIRNTDQRYSADYCALTRDFYLFM